jgi:hypothetical protein
MPRHSAPRRYRIDMRFPFDAWDVLPFLQHVHSRDWIIPRFFTVSFELRCHRLVAPAQAISKGLPWCWSLALHRRGLHLFQWYLPISLAKVWKATFAGWFSLSSLAEVLLLIICFLFDESDCLRSWGIHALALQAQWAHLVCYSQRSWHSCELLPAWPDDADTLGSWGCLGRYPIPNSRMTSLIWDR